MRYRGTDAVVGRFKILEARYLRTYDVTCYWQIVERRGSTCPVGNAGAYGAVAGERPMEQIVYTSRFYIFTPGSWQR